MVQLRSANIFFFLPKINDAVYRTEKEACVLWQ